MRNQIDTATFFNPFTPLPMNEKSTHATSGMASMASTNQIESQTQWTKYHTKGGHGFAMEDAHALHDRQCGRSVDQCGRSNELNGADRIVNGQPIQTKCCGSASRTFSSGFDSATGLYRYAGQKFEVPSDQYAEVVQRMRQAITDGKVPGVNDPNQATNIVVKGRYTYAQAQKIAKAGNLESIKFDIRVQASACAFACGISGGIAFIIAKCNGESTGDALKIAAKSGLQSAGVVMLGGVAAQQFLRTTIGRNCAAAATRAVRPMMQSAMKNELGKSVITKTASAVFGKNVTGAAAANVLTKAVRTNFIVSGAMAVATTVPDMIKLGRGKISGAEFCENAACNVSSVGGGWAGASTGAAIGSMVCPGIGTAIGGLLGGIAGGLGASVGTKKLITSLKTVCA